MTEQTQLRKSRWVKLEETLKQNSDIVLLDKQIVYRAHVFSTESISPVAHWMTFLVSPREPRYTLKGMEKARIELAKYLGVNLGDHSFSTREGMPFFTEVPGVTPAEFKIAEGYLILGRISYSEPISNVKIFHRVETTALDEDLSGQKGFVGNRQVKEWQSIATRGKRIVNIAVLPSESVYQFLLKKSNEPYKNLYNYTFERWEVPLLGLCEFDPKFKRLLAGE